jgi:hypothetical protein
MSDESAMLLQDYSSKVSGLLTHLHECIQSLSEDLKLYRESIDGGFCGG